MMAKQSDEYIFADEILVKLSKLLGDLPLQRVIIDIEFKRFPVIYVQGVATRKVLTINWGDLVDNAKIIQVDDKE